MHLDVPPKLKTRFPTMIGHGVQVFLEGLKIHHHAGCWQILFAQVFEIAPGDTRFKFCVAGGAAGRSGCYKSTKATGRGRQKLSASIHTCGNATTFCSSKSSA